MSRLGTARPKTAHVMSNGRSGRFAAGSAGMVLAIAAAVSVSTFAAGPASAATSFVLDNATERVATGSPTPATGTEVFLPSTGSSATAAVSGWGRVVVGATGVACDGQPVLNVNTDGVDQGNLTLLSARNYGTYLPVPAVANGTHTVKLSFVNDYAAGSCDRSISLGSVKMEYAAKPDSSNTGVPDGTVLTPHAGDITVTQDGTVINGLDIQGSVYVHANNVLITRSLIRGGPASPTNKALVASWWNNTNLTIQDSTLAADFPSYYIDGISGSNITAKRVDVSRVVDPIKVVNGNVTVLASWLHSNAHFDPDPQQSDGKTHDDGVQIEGGSGTTLTGNVIENGHNSAVMVTQNHAATSNVKITNNWLRDGACTVNVTQAGTGGKGAPIQGMLIQGNKFGPGSYGTTCPMRLPAASPITVTANVWDGTTKPALANRF